VIGEASPDPATTGARSTFDTCRNPQSRTAATPMCYENPSVPSHPGPAGEGSS
jgi:hypothetical protein